jgi:hypothetical protein
MKNQILDTMRLAFVIKLLAKDMFFTLAPLPDFIQTKNSSSGELDIDLLKGTPKDYTYKFFIAKDSSELGQGNFYAIEVLPNSNRVLVTPHTLYEDTDEILLNDDCIIYNDENKFGCSEGLFESLKSFFEKKQ